MLELIFVVLTAVHLQHAFESSADELAFCHVRHSTVYSRPLPKMVTPRMSMLTRLAPTSLVSPRLVSRPILPTGGAVNVFHRMRPSIVPALSNDMPLDALQ